MNRENRCAIDLCRTKADLCFPVRAEPVEAREDFALFDRLRTGFDKIGANGGILRDSLWRGAPFPRDENMAGNAEKPAPQKRRVA